MFGGVGDDREGAEDVGEFDFGELIEVGDDAVEFGAECCPFNFVGCAVAALTPSPSPWGEGSKTDFFREIVKFGGGADEFSGAIDDFGKPFVTLFQARNRRRVDIKEI